MFYPEWKPDSQGKRHQYKNDNAGKRFQDKKKQYQPTDYREINDFFVFGSSRFRVKNKPKQWKSCNINQQWKPDVGNKKRDIANIKNLGIGKTQPNVYAAKARKNNSKRKKPDDCFNKYALFRYLTSKGLRKDAAGLSKLGDADIRNIEKGIPNYLFANKYSLNNRIYQTIWEFNEYQRGANPAGNSVVQRIEYFKIALQVIRENFWFGTGTGGYFPAYQKKYDEHPFFSEQKFRQRSHNMFLSYWVDFGLVGLIFICFAYSYPVFRQRKTKSYLLLTFSLIVLLSFLNEDTLNNHDAITFFAFFYSLFLFGKYEDVPLAK